jgi:hypothetical protein
MHGTGRNLLCEIRRLPGGMWPQEKLGCQECIGLASAFHVPWKRSVLALKTTRTRTVIRSREIAPTQKPVPQSGQSLPMQQVFCARTFVTTGRPGKKICKTYPYMLKLLKLTSKSITPSIHET